MTVLARRASNVVDWFGEIAAGLLFGAGVLVGIGGLLLPLLIVLGVLPR